MATRHVAMITDRLVWEGRWQEGGAQRHLWHLARLALDSGVRVTVYQASSTSLCCDLGGVRVVGVVSSVQKIWHDAVRYAVADGATHLYFHYLDQIPRWRLPLPTSAASHGVFWDHPYDHTMRRWYPHGRLDRFALPLWRVWQQRLVMTNVARCTAVLSTDSSFYHVIQGRSPSLRSRVHVAYNFFDTDENIPFVELSPLQDSSVLEPLMQAKESGRSITLIPRNLSLVRGGGWLVRIIEEVDKRTNGGVQFVLCGSAVQTNGRANRYERALAHDVNALPASIRCHLSLLDGVPHELMGRAYELSDLVLIPTYSHESTSLAAIEGMSRGRPVVATNVGGLSDVVADGWTGFLVAPTVQSIVAAVVRLVDDPLLRERFGRQARIEAYGRFGLDLWKERLVPFMESSGWLD